MSWRAEGMGVDAYRLWRHEQSWHYEQHWTLHGELVKVEVKRGIVDSQSYARVKIWSDMAKCWQFLCHITIEDVPAHVVSYVMPRSDGLEGMFENTCEQLLDRAATILAARPG